MLIKCKGGSPDLCIGRLSIADDVLDNDYCRCLLSIIINRSTRRRQQLNKGLSNSTPPPTILVIWIQRLHAIFISRRLVMTVSSTRNLFSPIVVVYWRYLICSSAWSRDSNVKLFESHYHIGQADVIEVLSIASNLALRLVELIKVFVNTSIKSSNYQ